MFSLYIALTALGLSAVDPIGIAIMPILLVQERPYKRVFVFLFGSFMSLMFMGILFAKGLGRFVLSFEHQHPWFVPTVEFVAGLILLSLAVFMFMRLISGKVSVDPSEKTRKWLRLGYWQLFIAGALLVAVQSVVDVVFLIAMIRVGQLELSNLSLVIAVATYSISALVLQIAVVGAFYLSPQDKRQKTLDSVHTLLIKYSSQVLIFISLVLSFVLFTLSLLKIRS